MVSPKSVLPLLALGLFALGLLALAAYMAVRARRPKVTKPPRRSFEHGRRLAHMRRALTTQAALDALRNAPVGALTNARGSDAQAEVTLTRRKNQPCIQAAGYLAGLFESAWAHEVLVGHPECAGPKGGVCHYSVRRAPIASDPRAAAASTPGSAGARRRSPGARAEGR